MLNLREIEINSKTTSAGLTKKLVIVILNFHVEKLNHIFQFLTV